MPTPVFQRIDPIRDPGGFGTDPFGSGSTFGGSDDEPVEVSIVQLGSDDLTTDLNRQFGGVTLSRYGIPIGSRTWFNARRWRLNINIASQDYIESLRPFWEQKTFRLYPDSTTDLYYTVMWMETEFAPRRVSRPGFYSLNATLVETPD